MRLMPGGPLTLGVSRAFVTAGFSSKLPSPASISPFFRRSAVCRLPPPALSSSFGFQGDGRTALFFSRASAAVSRSLSLLFFIESLQALSALQARSSDRQGARRSVRSKGSSLSLQPVGVESPPTWRDFPSSCLPFVTLGTRGWALPEVRPEGAPFFRRCSEGFCAETWPIICLILPSSV